VETTKTRRAGHVARVREIRVTVKLLFGNYWNATIIETEDYEGDISRTVRKQVPACEVRLAQQFDGLVDFVRSGLKTSADKLSIATFQRIVVLSKRLAIVIHRQSVISLNARIFQIGSFRVETKSKYGRPQICCLATERCSCSSTFPLTANAQASSQLHTKTRCNIWHAVRTTHCVPAVSKLRT